ncbi:TPA: hypothetical protein ACGTRQ_003782 [Vibrio parahaemolyticus]
MFLPVLSETLKIACKLYEQCRDKRPLKGIMISHSHTVHYEALASEQNFRIAIYVLEGFITAAGSLTPNSDNGLPKHVKEITHDNQVVSIDGV